MRTSASQLEHDRLVARFARALEDEGLTDVRADVEGFERPLPISPGPGAPGAPDLPDVTARGPVPTIAEVETSDSLLDPHTERQWKVFALYAAGQACRFCLVVPTGAEMIAEERLQELGIVAEVWPITLGSVTSDE